MKLTLIGGGGVRSPLFVMTLLRWHQRIGLTELCLMDIDERKLGLFSALCRELVRRAGDPFTLSATSNARLALSGAAHVVTTVRVGFEQGRATDERIALRHGVLGQETTGPGGFSMALRSIPAILGYAGLLREVSPRAWLYNFTNPSGLVTQVLRDAGHERTIGICDGANAAQDGLARWAGVEPASIRAEVFGLNHLSWCRRAWLNGADILPAAFADDRFLHDSQGLFEPALLRQVGMHCNEYLYYYYYAEKALAAISGGGQTRGEEIVELNQRLIQQLETINVERDPERALRAFFGYEKRRGATYMHYAYHRPHAEEAGSQPFDADIPAEAGEGYAGVALSIIEALEKGLPLYTALNVPNRGAIDGLDDDDVVEVSCRVDGAGVQPLPIGEVPLPQLALMQTVKNYERLTVQAVRQRSRRLAVDALMAHPLVLSYSRARPLVDEFLAAHAVTIGGPWNE